MKFYLSGGMEYKKNVGMKWRDWITLELEKIRHDAINPIKLELEDENDDFDGTVQAHLIQLKLDGKIDEVRRLVREILFRKDMFAIQMADATILYYDESVQKGAGTLSEAWESFREGRPIYLVSSFDPKDLPAWLIGETTQIFPDFEKLLEYVSDHSFVIRDQMHAQKIADDILGGIY